MKIKTLLSICFAVLLSVVFTGLSQAIEKQTENGIFIIKDANKTVRIAVEKEQVVKQEGFGTSYTYYGFHANQYTIYISAEEFYKNGVLVRGMGNTSLRMGKGAGLTLDNNGEFYCHAANGVDIGSAFFGGEVKKYSGCGGSDGRDNNKFTEFIAETLDDKTKLFKPTEKLSRGHHFFWIDTGNGFTEGYPLILN